MCCMFATFPCILYVCFCVVCLLVYCMFACVLYVCYVVIRSVRGSETTRYSYWICALQTRRCIIRLGLYSVQILQYAVIVYLLVYCMFACVLYVCLCVVCLLVCCMFAMWRLGLYSVQKLRDAAIGFVLSKPDAVLFDWVSTLYKSYSMRGLYVCLCIVCFLVYCMFAWVLYVCNVVIRSVLSSETTRCGDWICALQTQRCIIRLGLYCVKILQYAVIVCLLCIVCLFVCCLCLLCGDWVCTAFRNYEMRRLDLCSPNPTLYYSIGSLLCTNLTLCDDCMFACVLYVCLCVVCLFVCCMFVMW